MSPACEFTPPLSLVILLTAMENDKDNGTVWGGLRHNQAIGGVSCFSE